ncbi:MAG: flagellar basal body rod protein FlgB [Armatimonadota bacterium]|nr:flagellar basal body rod protein FlgB [Armatimonadota bacterium]
MRTDLFGDPTSSILAKALDAAAARHRAIANNIANVETPGYKRIFVSFEEELKRALEEGSTRRTLEKLAELSPVQHIDWYSPSRPDGNNVCVDAEIADLVRNTMKQKAVSVLLEAKIAMLRAAITEGKR